MNFDNLSIDFHYSILQYLRIPDVISLSQSSRRLRQIYLGFAWETCIVGSQGHSYPGFSVRSISPNALIHTFRDDPTIQHIKGNIRRLIISSLDMGVRAGPENQKYFIANLIEQSEFPALINIKLDYLVSMDGLDTSSEICSPGFYEKVSRSDFLNFDMFEFSHLVNLVASTNFKFFWSLDPQTFTSNEISAKGVVSLRLSYTTTLYSTDFGFLALEPQQVYDNLSLFKINEVSIEFVASRILSLFLNALAKLESLSTVTIYPNIYTKSSTGEHMIWPPAQLLNHECFSKLKTFILCINEVDDYDIPTLEYVEFPEYPTELKYVTSLQDSIGFPFHYTSFWKTFLFPKIEHLNIRYGFCALPEYMLQKLTKLDYVIDCPKMVLKLIEIIPEMRNLKCLKLEFNAYGDYPEGVDNKTCLGEQLNVAKVFAKACFENSFFSAAVDNFLLPVIMRYKHDLKMLALKYMEISNYSYASSSLHISDCFLYKNLRSTRDTRKYVTLVFLFELMLYKIRGLPSLTTLELQMESYVDFFGLQSLIYEQSALESIDIIINYLLPKKEVLYRRPSLDWLELGPPNANAGNHDHHHHDRVDRDDSDDSYSYHDSDDYYSIESLGNSADGDENIQDEESLDNNEDFENAEGFEVVDNIQDVNNAGSVEDTGNTDNVNSSGNIDNAEETENVQDAVNTEILENVDSIDNIDNVQNGRYSENTDSPMTSESEEDSDESLTFHHRHSTREADHEANLDAFVDLHMQNKDKTDENIEENGYDGYNHFLRLTQNDGNNKWSVFDDEGFKFTYEQIQKTTQRLEGIQGIEHYTQETPKKQLENAQELGLNYYRARVSIFFDHLRMKQKFKMSD